MQITLNVPDDKQEHVLALLGLCDAVVVSDAKANSKPVQAEENVPVAKETPVEETASEVTREEVAEAVLEFAKNSTSAAAISILEEVGGAPQLAKVDPSKYADVLAALKG